MISVKRIGDLTVTKESGGNEKHGGFWHYFMAGCHCVRSTTETILCSPPIETTEAYYKCGYWEKTTYKKTRGNT